MDCQPADKCYPQCICYPGYVYAPNGFGCIQPSECGIYDDENEVWFEG